HRTRHLACWSPHHAYARALMPGDQIGASMAVLRKTWVTALGWVLTVAGIALLALPGPGMLTLVAGLAILSQEYDWAERRLHPVKEKAFEAAAAGVETWPRIAMSTLGALALIAAGIVWWVNPT